MKVSELRTKLYALDGDAEVEILREDSYIGVYAGSRGPMVKDIVKDIVKVCDLETRKAVGLTADVAVETKERAVLIVGRDAEDDHRA